MLGFDWIVLVVIMAPNVKTRLLYENDDVERMSTFEKKGKEREQTLYFSRTLELLLSNVVLLYAHMFLLLFVECSGFRVPLSAHFVCQWDQST